MNTDILRKAGIDYDHCVRRFAGRAPLFEKALVKFSRDDTILRIRQAFEAHDDAGLLASAHEMKGVSGNIGLTALYEASDALVRMLRQGSFTQEDLGVAFRRLDDKYQAIHEATLASMEPTV